MVRTSVLWIILVTLCINSAKCRQTKNYPHSQVLSVDVKSLQPKDNGAIVAGEPSQLIVFGKYLQENVQLTLTKQPGTYGGPCPQHNGGFPPLTPYKYMLLSDYSKIFVYIPEYVAKHMYGDNRVWLCYRTDKLSQWIHYGENSNIPIKNRLNGRRHLLRRSLIDDLTPAEVQASTEAVEGGEIFKNPNPPSLTVTDSDSSNSTNHYALDEISTSVASGGDFRTRPNERSISEFSNGELPNPKLRQPVLTMSLLEEEYATEKSPQEGELPVPSGLRVYGMRAERHSKGLDLDGRSISLMASYDAVLRIFGTKFTDKVEIQFTAKEQEFGTDCDISTSDTFTIIEVGGEWATLKVRLPPMAPQQDRWYLCARSEHESRAIHQGSNRWLTITTYTLPLPIWVQVILLASLLLLSGLFSGLNLGLMALDKTELKVVSNTGTATERSYARAIEPVRRHGNFLLCTLLLGNVLVNSTLTILLDNLSSGLIAVIGSTIGIVIFGEILPQAICSRHGLAIGAKTVWLVRIFMILTGIVSWPVSKILDKVLGEELGNTYNRERLKELIRVTQDSNDIKLEEQNIICGALELHRKTVAEIMTKLEDVFMLSVDANLDFHTINEIMQQGYSRVPVFESDRSNIVSILFIKDLAFIDPDDNTPLMTLTQFYQNPCLFIFEDTTLDVMFKEFKTGNKGHMAFVQRVIDYDDCDPFYEIVGLVTIEDVIEELIQEEIIDETDVFTDNRTKRKRKILKRRDFKEFYQTNNTSSKKVQISSQMHVAAYQFLRTSVEPFKEEFLSEGILKKLLTQDIIHVMKPSGKELTPADHQSFYIYTLNKPVDYFVLILEGHVEVTIGRENLTFEGGPFSYYGVPALLIPTSVGESPSLPNQLSRGSIQSLESVKFCFSPDFSVKAISDVTYLKIRRNHYFAARRAFVLLQSQKDPQAEENFVKEMAKIISEEHLSLSVYDNSAKEASVKDTLLNGGAPCRCNGEEEIALRSSHRKTTGSLNSTPSKEKNCEVDSNDGSAMPPNTEDC